MAMEFLDGPNVVVCFQQVCGKEMTKGVDVNGLDYTCKTRGSLHGLLETVFMNMVPSNVASSRVFRQAFCRKLILPSSLRACIAIFPFECIRFIFKCNRYVFCIVFI